MCRSATTSTFGWWLGQASVCNFVAAMVLAIARMVYEDYQIQAWHQWLCYAGISWLAVAVNILGNKILPLLNKAVRMYLSTYCLYGGTMLTGVSIYVRDHPGCDDHYDTYVRRT